MPYKVYFNLLNCMAEWIIAVLTDFNKGESSQFNCNFFKNKYLLLT